MIKDISRIVVRWPVEAGTCRFSCKLLMMGPLVAAKMRAHCERESDDDYHDLFFACTSRAYAASVRRRAGMFPDEWKDCFLEKVAERNPGDEGAIRWALRMEDD